MEDTEIQIFICSLGLFSKVQSHCSTLKPSDLLDSPDVSEDPWKSGTIQVNYNFWAGPGTEPLNPGQLTTMPMLPVCNKTRRLISLLYRRFYMRASSSTLFKLCTSFIRPYLEYSSTVWNPYLERNRSWSRNMHWKCAQNHGMQVMKI